MLKILSRPLFRQSSYSSRSSRHRFLSTAPPFQKSQSWKSSVVRWGAAAGGVYYYNTSNVFAEEPSFSTAQTTNITDNSLPTLESISSSRRNRTTSAYSDNVPAPALISPQTSAAIAAVPEAAPLPSDTPQTPQAYEDEASQQGAFNEETGEINWDCPCLGGMAHGPCGEQFREAFSCFVYSKEEPKGMDCIDRFKGMQDCFREHPDVYGNELADQEGEEEEEEALEQAQGVEATAAIPTTATPAAERNLETSTSKVAGTKQANETTAQVAKDHRPVNASEELVPKASYDGTLPNKGK